MDVHCHSCKKAIAMAPGTKPGRRETCTHCGSDLHSCLNCRHFDRSAYRECRENINELVKDKDRSNFCDSFSPNSAPNRESISNPSKDLLKAAEALFKKKDG